MTIDPAILVGVFRDLGINLSASVIFEFLKSRFGKSLGVEQSTFEHELSSFLKIHGVQAEAATVIKALADSGFLSIKGSELVAPDGILIGAGEGARFSFGEGSASKTTKTAIHANGNARVAGSNAAVSQNTDGSISFHVGSTPGSGLSFFVGDVYSNQRSARSPRSQSWEQQPNMK